MALLTAEDVHVKEFTPTKFREGYDSDEVDEFLDEVVETLATLQEENIDLKHKLAEAERKLADYAAQPPVQHAPVPPEPQVEMVAEESSPTPAPVDDPKDATSILAMAQRLHDEYVRNGEEEGNRIVAESRAQSEQIIREAEDEKRRIHDSLSDERAELERRIDDLKRFEKDYRAQIHAHLESLIQEVDKGVEK